MRKKLKRLQEIIHRENIIEEYKFNYDTILGKWKEKYFNNSNDIILELGCGKGEYTINLARSTPVKKFYRSRY